MSKDCHYPHTGPVKNAAAAKKGDAVSPKAAAKAKAKASPKSAAICLAVVASCIAAAAGKSVTFNNAEFFFYEPVGRYGHDYWMYQVH